MELCTVFHPIPFHSMIIVDSIHTFLNQTPYHHWFRTQSSITPSIHLNSDWISQYLLILCVIDEKSKIIELIRNARAREIIEFVYRFKIETWHPWKNACSMKNDWRETLKWMYWFEFESLIYQLYWLDIIDWIRICLANFAYTW